MELFPATDDDQWTLIKELIDDCDYYILIIGGRYGSLNSEGISYTQMEYEYAIKTGLPVISFLHQAPDTIPVGKTDKDKNKEDKLKDFRSLASQKMIKFWNSPKELGSVVSRSLVKLIKTKPRIGWVKADRISTDEANLEILELKQRIQELEDELRISSEKDLKDLSQGNEKFQIGYTYNKGPGGKLEIDSIELTWNQIFSKTCTILMDEAKEDDYRDQLNSYLHFRIQNEKPTASNLNVISDIFMSILIQFKALGLIEKSTKKRSLKDTNTYWKLTQKGDDLITKLRAIRKKDENKTATN